MAAFGIFEIKFTELFQRFDTFVDSCGATRSNPQVVARNSTNELLLANKIGLFAGVNAISEYKSVIDKLTVTSVLNPSTFHDSGTSSFVISMLEITPKLQDHAPF